MEKRFQWSRFTGDRDAQFVIREDDWDLFVEGVNKVLNLLGEDPLSSEGVKQEGSKEPAKPVEAKFLDNGVAPETAPKTCPVHPNKVLFFNPNGRFGPFWSHKTDQIGGNGKPIYCNGVDKSKPTPVDEYERVQASY